jgi:glutathione S-transferase
MKLVIANKNYSSWSLRPWLLLRHSGIAFDEEKLGFNDPDFKAKALRYSATARVPVLVDGDLVIWDSIAIAEYAAERYPDKHLWPEDARARAHARSLCAEMHSGFAAMRDRMAFNCELSIKNVLFDLDVMRDVARVIDLWSTCRARHAADGPFLFGRFSIADAFYAPVTRRFVTYGTKLPEVAERYVATIDALPAMQAWLAEAREEKDYVPHDELYREHR